MIDYQTRHLIVYLKNANTAKKIKKYLDKNISSEEITKLTETISRQVDDIGKLVDEFSSFARMPKAEIKIDNFSETIKECFNLFSNAHSGINFKFIDNKVKIFFLFDKFP